MQRRGPCRHAVWFDPGVLFRNEREYVYLLRCSSGGGIETSIKITVGRVGRFVRATDEGCDNFAFKFARVLHSG